MSTAHQPVTIPELLWNAMHVIMALSAILMLVNVVLTSWTWVLVFAVLFIVAMGSRELISRAFD